MLCHAVLTGTYYSTRCAAAAMRNRDDQWNALISGSAAGAAMGLPSRDPRTIMISTILVGTFFFVLDPFDPRYINR